MSGKYEQKDNSGNLFRIPEEDIKSDKHPQYEGEFKTICPHCNAPATGWVKGWIKEAKTGSKFFSLAFKFKTKGGGQ
tara:strand:+ start:1297 stop:1527 length:231 start_codon:yes stop_codon:yes gene_type:complete